LEEKLPVFQEKELCHVPTYIFGRFEACLEAGGRYFETLLWIRLWWTATETLVIHFMDSSGFECCNAVAKERLEDETGYLFVRFARLSLKFFLVWL